MVHSIWSNTCKHFTIYVLLTLISYHNMNINTDWSMFFMWNIDINQRSVYFIRVSNKTYSNIYNQGHASWWIEIGFNHGLLWCMKHMILWPRAPQNPTVKPEIADHVARSEDHVLHISRQAMMKTYHGTPTRQNYGNMAHKYKKYIQQWRQPIGDSNLRRARLDVAVTRKRHYHKNG